MAQKQKDASLKKKKGTISWIFQRFDILIDMSEKNLRSQPAAARMRLREIKEDGIMNKYWNGFLMVC